MTEKLQDYNQKRDFEKTDEPQGVTENADEALRFVVQHHIARRDHFDFRLEWKGAMLSWAVPKGPSYDTSQKRLAIKVEDHPLEYRNFEGTIPKGQYGGGTVMIWDEGIWQPYEKDVDTGLNEGVLKFELNGRRLKGKWCLIKLKDTQDGDKENWLLFKEKDEFSLDSDGISDFATSIRTGRTMDEIEQGIEKKTTKNPFNNASVQLAKYASSLPQGDDWIFELKYDGYRIISYIENNKIQLVSRNGKDYTKHFITIANSLLEIANGRAMILDGEVTATDKNGNTSFQALQSYIKNPKDKSLTYFVFDLLSIDGEDLRNKPLLQRKEKLEELLKNSPKNLQYSRHFFGNGSKVFEEACKADMEGIVAKRANSIYSGARNNDWLKIKCYKRQEFVIGGYTLSDKRTSGISSLLLGVYEKQDLIFYGRTGTGFTQDIMKELEKKFEPLKQDECPFKIKPKIRKEETIFFLQPKLVAEIRFTELTEEKLLRQASFKGLREDKNPLTVRNEEVEDELLTSVKDEENTMQTDINEIINRIKITSPDKILYEKPKVTKIEIIKFYASVAMRMLPYVKHRILSIVRCPKGVTEACFFKKHPDPSPKGIITIPVSNSNNEKDIFFYIEDEIGLISEAQMGALEFHTWGSRIEEIEKPDMMVFDLDPDEGMNLNTVRQGVKDLKIVLEELSLKSYLKTSGGKGYHVVVPFKPSANWDKFHDFAKSIAQVMEMRWPDRYTSNMRKVKRTNKIFIDWVRNARGATSIAPYSLRAREGAKVSMPISWHELETIAPDGIDMAQALQRINNPDPWKGFYGNEQKLNQ